MLLSIDVGIRNLAMCLIDPETKKIHQWDVSGIPPQSSDGLFVSLKKHVDARAWTRTQSRIVLIEKQPDRNKTMKSVEHFLHTYYLCHDKEVIIWDARHKIPDVAGAGRSKYVQRKKTSIERCRQFLQVTNPEWINLFDQHKKKDDLADTCMQALSFIDRIVPETSKKPKKQTPRRPTEHQRNTQYSRSNLAWLYTHGEHENARFRKDLARYYTCIEELFRDFTLE
jgi:Poxvirus A22 protein